MKCKVCEREASESDFCPLHLKAYENVLESYDVWIKALKISWKEYLNEIEQNPLTGEWVKEVANYILNNKGIHNVKKS